MKGNRLDTRRVRSDGKMLGGHHGCSGYVDIAEGRSHVRDQVPGAFGGGDQRCKEKVCSEAVTISLAPPVPVTVPSEPGRLNQALHRMRACGYEDEARQITHLVREPRLPEEGHQKCLELLLKALHRRGPFTSEWDFHSPRGIRRPAIA